MSTDFDAAGDLATAGLVARALEGEAGKPHEAGAHGGPCANCGAVLQGAFCHACGQSGHVHRSLLHLFEELLHGLLHFDAKGWRTLPLLVARPGLLTRRYIDGQRARHVSPLALFLFTVFLMFFVFSFTGGPSTGASVMIGSEAERAEAREELAAELEGAREALAEAQAEVEKARPAGGEGLVEAEEKLKEAQVEERVAAALVDAFDTASAHAQDKAAGTEAQGQDAGSEKLRSLGTKFQGSIDTGSPELDGKLRHHLENPELTTYKLKNTAYKFSFMLIPISLPFLWLLFAWKRDVTMYDHAVFSLYSLSFMSLLFVVVALLSIWQVPAPLTSMVVFIPPLHMFMQLRETYRLSIFSAAWRTVALLCVAGTAFSLFVVFILMVGLLK